MKAKLTKKNLFMQTIIYLVFFLSLFSLGLFQNDEKNGLVANAAISKMGNGQNNRIDNWAYNPTAYYQADNIGTYAIDNLNPRKAVDSNNMAGIQTNGYTVDSHVWDGAEANTFHMNQSDQNSGWNFAILYVNIKVTGHLKTLMEKDLIDVSLDYTVRNPTDSGGNTNVGVGWSQTNRERLYKNITGGGSSLIKDTFEHKSSYDGGLMIWNMRGAINGGQTTLNDGNPNYFNSHPYTTATPFENKMKSTLKNEWITIYVGFGAEQYGGVFSKKTSMQAEVKDVKINFTNTDTVKPTISEATFSTTDWAQSKYASFTVTDNGSGIKKVQIKRKTEGWVEGITFNETSYKTSNTYSSSSRPEVDNNIVWVIQVEDNCGNKTDEKEFTFTNIYNTRVTVVNYVDGSTDGSGGSISGLATGGRYNVGNNIALRASFNNNYYFEKWIVNGGQFNNVEVKGLALNQLLNGGSKIKDVTVQAHYKSVNAVNTESITYTGETFYSTPYTSNGFAFANSTPQTGFASVGIHTYTMDVKYDGVVVGRQSGVKFEVLPCLITYAIDNENSIYNQNTGWGSAFTVNLMMNGVVSQGVSKYQYSINNGLTWYNFVDDDGISKFKTTINTIANETGCKATATFTLATGENAKQFKFRAVHNVNGSGEGTNSAVSYTNDAINIKIDNTKPEIIDISCSYTSHDWTNQTVEIIIFITFGQSGALVEYKTRDGQWTTSGLGSNPGYNMGLDVIEVSGAVTLTLKENFNEDITFRLWSGSGVTSSDGSDGKNFGYVKIDKDAPEINNITFEKNNLVWTGSNKVDFTLNDNNWSGVKSVVDIATNTELSIVDSKYGFEIHNSSPYSVLVTDNAGNKVTYIFQAKVDNVVPVFDSIDGNGYIANQWTKEDITLTLKTKLGSSGAKLQWSVDGTDYTSLDTIFGDTYRDNEIHDILQHNADTEYALTGDRNDSFHFRLISQSGIVSEAFYFGNIKQDQTAPVLSDKVLTNYDLLTWTNIANDMSFNVADNGFATANANSGLKSVTLSQGSLSTANNGYQFYITNSNEYIITMTDNAGNVAEYRMQANVDMIAPTFTYTAKVGETQTLYYGMWLNISDLTNAFVKLVADISFGTSGVKMQYSIDNGINWLTFGDDIFLNSGTEIQQNLNFVHSIMDNQNQNYKIRVINGAGVVVTPTTDLGAIKIDTVAPEFLNMTYNNVIDQWTFNDIKGTFKIKEDISGVATITKNDEDITKANDFYSFVMNDYIKYIIIAIDKAGNKTQYTYQNNDKTLDYILPLIDQTDGYELKINTNGYNDNTWTNKDINLTFTYNKTFGHSGMRLSFSTDNSNYVEKLTIGSKEVTIIGNGTDNLSMLLNMDQDFSYSFRITNLAGRSYTSSPISIRRDTAVTQLTYLAKVGNNEYDSRWVAEDINIHFDSVIGASGAKIEYTIGEDSAWYVLKANDKITTYVYSIKTTQSQHYSFRIVSGAGTVALAKNSYNDGVRAPILVQIDKEPISINIIASEVDSDATGGTYIPTTWTFKDVKIDLTNTFGPSGSNIAYCTSEDGINYTPFSSSIDANIGSFVNFTNSNNTILKLTGTQSLYYKVRIQNVTGEKEYVFGLVNIDKMDPKFRLIATGDRVISQNNEWWTSSLKFEFELLTLNISSSFIEYSTDNGSSWSREGIQNNNNNLSYTLSHNIMDTKSYMFRVISGSGYCGTETTVKDTDYTYSSSPTPSASINNWGTVRIDTNLYSVTANQFVDKYRSDTFANLIGLKNTFKRGDNVDIGISANLGYYYRSISIGDSIVDTVNNKTTKIHTYNIKDITKNIELNINYYKELNITYSNNKQAIQNGAITAVELAVSERDFDTKYGKQNFKIKYSNQDVIPQLSGKYIVSITLENDNFIILNDYDYLTIVHFNTSGTSVSPYLIKDLQDLKTINNYSNKDSAFDYLGTNRLTANYLQTVDIVSDQIFAIIDTFSGVYNGNNHTITLNNSAQSGIFKTLDNATVKGLKVLGNINITSESDFNDNIGLIANFVDNGSNINGCYAFGNIKIQKVPSKLVYIGGLAGDVTNSTIASSMADVKITLDWMGTYDQISVGGLVGQANNSSIEDCFVISTIVANNTNADASSMIGAISGNINKTSVTFKNVKYLDINLTINHTLYTERPVGTTNASSTSGAEALTYEHFINNSTIIGATGTDAEKVAQLTRARITKSGLKGLGTPSDPFKVANIQELLLVDSFSFACFAQTADIDVEDSQFQLSAGAVFGGVYNANGYKISNYKSDSTNNVVGLFQFLSGTVSNLTLYNVVINVEYVGSDRLFVGALAGVMINANISDILITGKIDVNAGEGTSYVGGVIGLANNSSLKNIVSMATMTSKETSNIIIMGGILGQVEGNSNLESLVCLSSLIANYKGRGIIGSSVGNVVDGLTQGSQIVNVENNAYANGNNTVSSIGHNGSSNIKGLVELSYRDAVDTSIGGKNVGEIINNAYPFDGIGTLALPFIINNEDQLTNINQYMYASFKLGANITLSDTFKTIGVGSIFTGNIEGGGYSISNIRKPLIQNLAGSVSNLALNVFKAEAYLDGQNGIFGALAVYSQSGSSISMTQVSGQIEIKANSNTKKLIVGGLVGISNGLELRGYIHTATINVESSLVNSGSIVGEISGKTTISGAQIGANISCNGGTVRAGYVAGKSLQNKLTMEDIKTNNNAKVLIKNVEKPNDHFVGWVI